jgi:hypothetical protein
MRIIKQRLLEMIPDLRVWLDVDDLADISRLEDYIEQCGTVLIFCTKGCTYELAMRMCIVPSTLKYTILRLAACILCPCFCIH